MRILITNTGPWGTGSGTVADGIMQELKKRGHEVMAFFPDSGLPGPGYNKYYGHSNLYCIVSFPITYKGVPLYTFPLIIPDPNPRNYKAAWTFKDLSEVELTAYFAYIREKLTKVLDKFRPDVIECQHIWAFDHIVGDLGYNYISVAHHSDQLGFLYDPRMRSIAHRAAKKATYIIAISDYVRREVIELYDISRDKVITITNGYDQTIFYPFSVDRKQIYSELGLTGQEDLPVVTFCGKISRRKGIDVLLQANRIIQKKSKSFLWLAGCGDLESFSKEEQRKFCLENILLLGHLDPQVLSRLHNISRLSVVPSRSEGFGIAALEAMGCALPLVASKVGGLDSFVVGELVKPEDPVALAEAILKLMQLPEKNYRKLCGQALETARPYSWATLVDKRMPYYRKIATLNR